MDTPETILPTLREALAQASDALIVRMGQGASDDPDTRRRASALAAKAKRRLDELAALLKTDAEDDDR